MYNDFLKTQPIMSDQLVRFGQKVWDAAQQKSGDAGESVNDYSIMMTRILFNRNSGTFLEDSLSEEFHNLYFSRRGHRFTERSRDDPEVFRIIDKLGGIKNIQRSDVHDSWGVLMGVRELPMGTRYYIHCDDGGECIVAESEIEWRTA